MQSKIHFKFHLIPSLIWAVWLFFSWVIGSSVHAAPSNTVETLTTTHSESTQGTAPRSGAEKPKLSIVIDDLGDNSHIARQLLSLSGQFTAAILPYTPHAAPIAQFARNNGHEVIMHLPMEALSRPDLLGPGALRADMQKQQIQTTLVASAKTIPNIVGFNNHMGSMLTNDTQKMTWVMESAKQNGWYFLDSKTTQRSVAQEVATQVGIPSIGRDIFLDHFEPDQREQLPQLLAQRLNQAKRIAMRRGEVVIICHPYPETLRFLAQEIDGLNDRFHLVKLSELLPESEHLAKSLVNNTSGQLDSANGMDSISRLDSNSRLKVESSQSTVNTADSKDTQSDVAPKR